MCHFVAPTLEQFENCFRRSFLKRRIKIRVFQIAKDVGTFLLYVLLFTSLVQNAEIIFCSIFVFYNSHVFVTNL